MYSTTRTELTGVQVPHVFSNPDPTTLIPLGSDPSHLALGHLMARMWISFAVDLTPNSHGGKYPPPKKYICMP